MIVFVLPNQFLMHLHRFHWRNFLYFYVQFPSLANSYTKMKLEASDYTSRIKHPTGNKSHQGFFLEKKSKFFLNVSIAWNKSQNAAFLCIYNSVLINLFKIRRCLKIYVCHSFCFFICLFMFNLVYRNLYYVACFCPPKLNPEWMKVPDVRMYLNCCGTENKYR